MPFVETQHARIFYQLHGHSGPKVLLIQGVGAIGHAWHPQTIHLSKTHQLATFDNRGIGQSTTTSPTLSIDGMAADSIALLDHLGWDSAHIAGHSMGGLIAQQIAIDYPRRVRSLALLCTVARGRDAVRMTARLLATGIRMRIGTLRSRRRAFLSLIYPRDTLARENADALAARCAELFGRDLADQPPVIAQQLAALKRHDCTPHLARITAPTLVASAEHDPIAPPRYGQALAAAIPHARFELLQGRSHGAPIERPDLINTLLERHFTPAGTE
jgi:pimeloyl-ACP methyl ester carboxylesterase